MMTGRSTFNIYLLIIASSLLTGCETTQSNKRGKEASTLRLHLQANSDGTPHTTTASVYREKPIQVPISSNPFLTEIDLESAAVVEVQGGFAIQVQFNRHGALLLENVTTVSRGRHIAILSQFTETRWLAAPLISRRITDGTLVFTPDASREEADRIVRGLSNFIVAARKKSKF
ncbi:MAG: hypothetical protein HY735_16600 [Verrucomicrobia bacterium]|nr:hypothetical protein [Verrucomicrobiota bacterium]